MRRWESLVERQIREATDEGKFDDLPHQGRPLPLEDDSAAGEWAMAYRMLKDAGAAPPWIEADKDARARLAERDRAPRTGEGTAGLGAPRDGACAASWTGSSRPRTVPSSGFNAEAPTEHQHRMPDSTRMPSAARLERAFRGVGPSSVLGRYGLARTAPRWPRRKASVCRSTSASVVTGDMSAMLWNGVMSTRRFIAQRWRNRSRSRIRNAPTARPRSAAAPP